MWHLLTSKPWRERLTYTAMSLLVVWHTLAMVVESSPDSVITRGARLLFHPYLSLFGLDNNWGFFAPNVNEGVQFRYVVEDAAGDRHTFIPADALSRFLPTSIWVKDRYKAVMTLPETYGDAAAASLCRDHASLHPVTITLLKIEQKDYWPEDRLNGKHPLDPEFVDVNTLKTVRCPKE
jgi:hypothetical protein